MLTALAVPMRSLVVPDRDPVLRVAGPMILIERVKIRMGHTAIILFTVIPSALVLTANTVNAQATNGTPPVANLAMFLIAIIVIGVLELAIVGFWVVQSRRREVGSRQLATWLTLPIVALLVFFMIGGGFTTCGA